MQAGFVPFWLGGLFDGAVGVCTFNKKLARGGADSAFLPMTTAIGPLGFICYNLQRLKVGRLLLRQPGPPGYMLVAVSRGGRDRLSGSARSATARDQAGDRPLPGFRRSVARVDKSAHCGGRRKYTTPERGARLDPSHSG